MLFLQPPAVNLSYFIRFSNEDVFFLCAFTLKTVNSFFLYGHKFQVESSDKCCENRAEEKYGSVQLSYRGEVSFNALQVKVDSTINT